MESISAPDDDDNVVMFCCRLLAGPSKNHSNEIVFFSLFHFLLHIQKSPILGLFSFCVHQFIRFVFRAFVSMFILYFVTDFFFSILHQIMNCIIGMCHFTIVFIIIFSRTPRSRNCWRLAWDS